MINTFNISPLLVTNVHWQVFNEYFPDGIRLLDQDSLSLNDPYAYIKVIKTFLPGNINDIANKLGFWAFIGVFQRKTDIFEFVTYSQLKFFYFNKTFILSGDLDMWHTGVLNTAKQELSNQTRNISNTCQIFLEQTLFRDTFKKYKKEYLADETFYLR